MAGRAGHWAASGVELLLADRKQRLLLRVPVPQDLDGLAPAVKSALKLSETGL
ncbi:hypothetical protein [Kitasatospora sp. NPDC090091]|uniref:hypothetical protein n=1 Tax=Kitasatospora sp. NPDC090091 TaxID=3364081 RepID=UPI00382EAFDB